MKKTNAKETSVVNINEVADLFQKYAIEAKEIAKKADEYKKKLIEYATNNRDKFVENALKFENGVYVECRRSQKGTVNNEIVTLEWVEKMVDNGFGDLIEIDIKEKEALKLANEATSTQLVELLDEVNFEVEEKETLAVYAK